MVPRTESYLKREDTNVEALAIAAHGTKLFFHKKSSNKLIRNLRLPRLVCLVSKYPPRFQFQVPPTAGPIVHDEAVMTEDGVDVSQDLEVLSGACMPKPEIPSGHTRSGR